jgi:hypothetical protein
METMDGSRRWRAVAGALVLAGACAAGPKPAPAPPRAKDSAAEKAAAQRAHGTPHDVQLEPEDERWGIDAARERRQQQDAAKAQKSLPPSKTDKSVDVTPPPPAPR